MSVRKRNEFLESNNSDDESDWDHDSEAEEQGRGALAGRAVKRQRMEENSDQESFDGQVDENEDVSTGSYRGESTTRRIRGSVASSQNLVSGANGAENDRDEPKSSVSKPPKQVVAARKASRKSGVIYISRVPPFMKPHTLKHFLSPHAPHGIGRIFLTPEDHEAHSRRVKSGGNKKKSFTDGWVEFLSKRDAKVIAETLNGNIIGGKKGNFYHDDLWNIKYLTGFKWSHLNEQISNENAERTARMREEIRKTRQENRAFLQDVERGKMLETIAAKKKAREVKGLAKPDAVGSSQDRQRKEFKQKKAVRGKEKESQTDGREQMTRIGTLIF